VQTRHQREHVDEDVVVDFHHEAVCTTNNASTGAKPQPADDDQLADVHYDYEKDDDNYYYLPSTYPPAYTYHYPYDDHDHDHDEDDVDDYDYYYDYYY